jgi:hypothetical protein
LEEIAWQREREKREWEREERQFKLKQQEIELQKLQLESQNKSSDHSTPYFDVTKHIRMVPPFQEREVDKYFLHFEKVAKNCNWPKESWTMLLQSVLLGKAREIFSQLTVEDSGEYDTVKQLILKGYELVPEAYSQKIRVLGKSSNKTFVQFVQEKAQLFDCWCTSENVENKYNHLCKLILIEEFTNCRSNDVRTFVTDKKPETLCDAARLADNFSLTHKFSTTGIKSNMSPSPRSNNLAFDNKRHLLGNFRDDIQTMILALLTTNHAMERQNLGVDHHRLSQLFVIIVNEVVTQGLNVIHLNLTDHHQNQPVLFLRQTRNQNFIVYTSGNNQSNLSLRVNNIFTRMKMNLRSRALLTLVWTHLSHLYLTVLYRSQMTNQMFIYQSRYCEILVLHNR